MAKITNADVAAYWDEHIHDLEVATAPLGSAPFFAELDSYRFDKLRYLPKLVDFGGFQQQQVLEVGCGVGIDLARFAAGGAQTTGIDLSPVAIELAAQNFAQRGNDGTFHVMDGANMTFADGSFDMVYTHGVLQYAVDPAGIIAEVQRVLKPAGVAIFMVYNRTSWLQAMTRLTGVPLEHEDAPVLELYTARELSALLASFQDVSIIPERFPVKTKLHGGLKGLLFNTVFVNGFNLLPRAIVGRYGWHLMAFARK